jgi:hypothetical protein
MLAPPPSSAGPAFSYPNVQLCVTLANLLLVPQLGAASPAAELITSILKFLLTLPHGGVCPDALKQVRARWRLPWCPGSCTQLYLSMPLRHYCVCACVCVCVIACRWWCCPSCP